MVTKSFVMTGKSVSLLRSVKTEIHLSAEWLLRVRERVLRLMGRSTVSKNYTIVDTKYKGTWCGACECEKAPEWYIYNPARLPLWPVASACHTRAMSQGCVPGRLLTNTSLIMLHGSTGGGALGGPARLPPALLNMGLPSRRPSAICLDTVDSWCLPRDTLNLS